MSGLVSAITHCTLATVLSVGAAAAESMQLDVNGQARTFLLERPATQGPRPTIVMLHGAVSNPAREAQLSGLGQLAPRHGFVAVFPEGRGGRWNHLPPGRESEQFVQVFEQYGGAPDDVAFLKTLAADLVRRGISDSKRLYLAGQSAGGLMTLRIVCTADAAFAAIGLLIASMPTPTGADCRLPKPLPVLMMNGTADHIMLYGGGPAGWPVERLVSFFRQNNGCTESAEKSVLPGQSPSKVEIERSTNCSGGPVDFYRIVGGGHDPRPQAPNASQLLVDFFRDKVRDDAAVSMTTQLGAQPTVAARAFNHIMYRRFDGPTMVTGDVRRTAADEWLETNTRGSKWSFRATTESNAEIILYDASRDIHVRMDLAARKMFVRKGTTQSWALLADIVGIEK